MFGTKKDFSAIAKRKQLALGVFYEAKEKLSKIMADEAAFKMNLEDEISELEYQLQLAENESHATKKLLDKLNDFLN
jgi:hypothetical protein